MVEITPNDLIYTFERPVEVMEYEMTKVIGLHVSKGLHEFLADYAKTFARVRVHKRHVECFCLAGHKARRISKALLTHKDLWPTNVRERTKILQIWDKNATRSQLTRMWKLQEYFLYGGQIKIWRGIEGFHMGNREGNARIPIHAYQINDGKYNIILTIDEIEVHNQFGYTFLERLRHER